MSRISVRSVFLIVAVMILTAIACAVAAGFIRERRTAEAFDNLKRSGAEIHLSSPHWCQATVSRNLETLVTDQVRLEFVGIRTPLIYIVSDVRKIDKDVSLSLQDVSLTNADILSLSTLTNLTTLSVSDLWMSDRSMKSIANIKQLQCLSIHGGQMTDGSCREIGGLSNLKHLCLVGLPIDDSGLSELANLEHLEILDLRETRVTDVGLAHLAKFTRIQLVDVRNTQVTAEGVQRLRKARPGIEIQF
ncbi:MAG: inlA 4 [Planctomycetaceae bacterium]|nr:inlA 4 [Planctomycetaceae bacterium]